jgi:hypothetical protein
MLWQSEGMNQQKLVALSIFVSLCTSFQVIKALIAMPQKNQRPFS